MTLTEFLKDKLEAKYLAVRAIDVYKASGNECRLDLSLYVDGDLAQRFLEIANNDSRTESVKVTYAPNCY